MQIRKKHLSLEDIIKKIYRKATPSDVEKWKAAKDLEWETMHRARKLAIELGLSMKLSDVDYQGDKAKATFYYTAEGRVDFRELIKRMAEKFRIRIEMRQIGMRQEASRLGGIGSCGRELCCSTWLTDFKTVSTSAARYQNLSLNTLKLAGQCGKLKCCLNYELDTYMDALKDIPDNADRLETGKGTARLQKTDIFKKLMWFSYPNEETWIPLIPDRVKEIQQLNKKGIKPDDLKEEVNEPETVPVKKAPDYENVVGQDSLTRLDDLNKRKKKNNRNRNNRNDVTSPIQINSLAKRSADGLVAGHTSKSKFRSHKPKGQIYSMRTPQQKECSSCKTKPHLFNPDGFPTALAETVPRASPSMKTSSPPAGGSPSKLCAAGGKSPWAPSSASWEPVSPT